MINQITIKEIKSSPAANAISQSAAGSLPWCKYVHSKNITPDNSVFRKNSQALEQSLDALCKIGMVNVSFKQNSETRKDELKSMAQNIEHKNKQIQKKSGYLLRTENSMVQKATQLIYDGKRQIWEAENYIRQLGLNSQTCFNDGVNIALRSLDDGTKEKITFTQSNGEVVISETERTKPDGKKDIIRISPSGGIINITENFQAENDNSASWDFEVKCPEDKPWQINVGVKKSADGTLEIKRKHYAKNAEDTKSLIVDAKEAPSGRLISYKKYFLWKNDKPKQYAEGFQQHNYTKSWEESIFWMDGSLSQYIQKMVLYPNGTRESNMTMFWENEKLDSIFENLIEEPNGKTKSGRKFTYSKV